jgi:hypothetical protein
MTTIPVIIMPSGSLRMIHDDRFDPRNIGVISIKRGSHVEPTKDGRWTADLHLVGGPVLGPFQKRSESITAELAWLQQHWLTAEDR